MRPISVCLFFFFLFKATAFAMQPSPVPVRGVYVPPGNLTPRYIQHLILQGKPLGLTAVVLHMKDPRGFLFWDTQNKTAKKLQAKQPNHTAAILRILQKNNIRPIAKVDVFADHRLARAMPETAILDATTGRPWKDRNGLSWTSPYHETARAYVISLAAELANMGFCEIQFDYIRFPSDGRLSVITHPARPEKATKPQAIATFLKEARETLFATGTHISADVFGLVAWKKEDFGVGQVAEKMAPYLDSLCPMLYPSHFPPGFSGWKTPSDHPFAIYQKSLTHLKARVDLPIRPWIQVFWYPEAAISAQIAGAGKAGTDSWLAWNAKGHYTTLFTALGGTHPLPAISFYPPLSALRSLPPRRISGKNGDVHLTDYGAGWTLLCAKPPAKGFPRYHTPTALCMTLDEAILDRVLTLQNCRFGPYTEKAEKAFLAGKRLTENLTIPETALRPRPILLEWQTTGRFTTKIPQKIRARFTP